MYSTLWKIFFFRNLLFFMNNHDYYVIQLILRYNKKRKIKNGKLRKKIFFIGYLLYMTFYLKMSVFKKYFLIHASNQYET